MSISRRKFIQQSGIAGTAFMIVPRHVLGGKGFVAPSDKVNIALVGAGGRGQRNATALMALKDVNITAIADPAEYWDLNGFYYRTIAGRAHAKKMVEDHKKQNNQDYAIVEYKDFREMLDKEKDLDAVLCATPDHTHAYISIISMQAGKHVYCEKPLTHNIWEARRVKQVAKETGLATQMGNQLHSGNTVRNTVEYLRAGAIGKIKEIHSWVPATRWIPSLDGVPTDSHPIPKNFDWNLWLGPRSFRAFHESYAPVTWRDYWDFGCGAMGDFGCHDLDAAVWGLDLPAPEKVVLYPAGFSDVNIAPYGEIGYFQFPASKGRPAVKLNWYAGGLRPDRPSDLPDDVELPRRGALYIGSKGTMLYGRAGRVELYNKGQKMDFSIKSPILSPTNGHHRDWVDAIKGGPSASSNFEYGAHLTEITLLGVLSLRLGGKVIDWDAENMIAKGIPEAEVLIKEPVRRGWEM